MFPTLRKRLSSFLLKEDGKISQQSLLSLGAFISGVVIGGVLASKGSAAHINDMSASVSSHVAIGQHFHHSSSTSEAGGSGGSYDCSSNGTGSPCQGSVCTAPCAAPCGPCGPCE